MEGQYEVETVACGSRAMGIQLVEAKSAKVKDAWPQLCLYDILLVQWHVYGGCVLCVCDVC